MLPKMFETVAPKSAVTAGLRGGDEGLARTGTAPMRAGCCAGKDDATASTSAVSMKRRFTPLPARRAPVLQGLQERESRQDAAAP